MQIHEERLPGEEKKQTSTSADTKTVRLTLTSRHILTRRMDPGFSMFGNENADDEFPEDFSPDAIATFDEPYDGDAYDDGEYDEEISEAANELCRRLMQIMEQTAPVEDEAEAEEDDTYVFRTLGQMRRSVDTDGNETVELTYTEDDSMENTGTTIVLTPAQNDRVSILHEGPVMSGLICERGVRHISAYKTPVMPFEVAVYAKSCDVSLTYENGGYIELDYLVELRGMDIQRTKMTIDAVCLD